MKKLITILLTFLSFCGYAQVPHPALLSLKGIGGNGDDQVATQVIKTEDGGFIIDIGSNSDPNTGNIDSFCNIGGERSIFVKYNSDASEIEWSKCYGYASGGDTGYIYMYPQNDGETVFGGEYLSGSGWGFYICKQDGLGNIVWSHGYSKGNSPLLRDMIATNDGGYLMIGIVYYTDSNFTVHNSGSGNADIGVLKLDSLGNKQWSRAIGGSEDEEAAKVLTAPDGYYILGTTGSDDSDCTGNHGGNDIYLACVDYNGTILWHNDIGGSGNEGGDYACADNKGGILIAGTTTSTDGDIHHYVGGGSDYYLADLNSADVILWDNCFGGAGSPYVTSVCKATDGSVWINGLSNGQGGEIDTVYDTMNGDAWLVHADSTGNFIDARVLGSLGYDKGSMVYPLPNGSVISGGFYSENNGSFSLLTDYGSVLSTDAFLAIFSQYTTGIRQIPMSNHSINVCPNPATTEVTITSDPINNYQLIITDVLGRIIYKTNYTGKAVFSVNNWQAGIYYVQVVSGDGFKIIRKLLIE
jgi:Secretion system C-terminal sorting domain